MDIHAGYGLCRPDFTIEERELAVFQNLDDAQDFIRMNFDLTLMGRRIYYLQEAGKDRKIFVPDKDDFVSGEEILSGKTKVYVPGWEIRAEYYDPEEGWEDFRSDVRIDYDDAEKIRMEYLDDGASDVDISEIHLDVQKHFRKTDEFFKGSPQSLMSKETAMTQTEAALNEMHKHGRPGGATIAGMVGDALENIDTRDIMRYFSEKIPGGENLIRDYLEEQITAENRMRDYLEEQITADEINKYLYRDRERLERGGR